MSIQQDKTIRELKARIAKLEGALNEMNREKAKVVVLIDEALQQKREQTIADVLALPEWEMYVNGLIELHEVTNAIEALRGEGEDELKRWILDLDPYEPHEIIEKQEALRGEVGDAV